MKPVVDMGEQWGRDRHDYKRVTSACLITLGIFGVPSCAAHQQTAHEAHESDAFTSPFGIATRF